MVNLEIQKIANWFRSNKMSVNVSKTKYILFRPRGKKILHNLDENGIIYNSNEIGGIDDNVSTMNMQTLMKELINFLEFIWMNTCHLTPIVQSFAIS